MKSADIIDDDNDDDDDDEHDDGFGALSHGSIAGNAMPAMQCLVANEHAIDRSESMTRNGDAQPTQLHRWLDK